MAKFPYRALTLMGAMAGFILMFLAFEMGYHQVAIFFGLSAIVQLLIPWLVGVSSKMQR